MTSNPHILLVSIPVGPSNIGTPQTRDLTLEKQLIPQCCFRNLSYLLFTFRVLRLLGGEFELKTTTICRYIDIIKKNIVSKEV